MSANAENRTLVLYGVADRDANETVLMFFTGREDLDNFVEALPGKYSVAVVTGLNYDDLEVVGTEAHRAAKISRKYKVEVSCTANVTENWLVTLPDNFEGSVEDAFFDRDIEGVRREFIDQETHNEHDRRVEWFEEVAE